MHRNFQDPARATTLRNRTRSCNQGLDVRNSLPPIAQGEVFFLDIPFYRTRQIGSNRSVVTEAVAQRKSKTPPFQTAEGWATQSSNAKARAPAPPRVGYPEK